MKILPVFIAFVTILGCRSLLAQTVASSAPFNNQPAILSIEEALNLAGITNIEYKDSINFGNDIGTLYEQASSDPLALEILFYRTQAGQVKLVTTWQYFTPFSNTSVLEHGQVANPANYKALLGSAGTIVVIDTTRPVQIQSNHSLIKVYGTDGYTYVMTMFYAYDRTNWYMLFQARNNLASNGGSTEVAPVSPSDPPAQ